MVGRTFCAGRSETGTGGAVLVVGGAFFDDLLLIVVFRECVKDWKVRI